MGSGGLNAARTVSSSAIEALGEDVATEKWPVWLRLVVIIGLSASLWACIIFAALAVFS